MAVRSGMDLELRTMDDLMDLMNENGSSGRGQAKTFVVKPQTLEADALGLGPISSGTLNCQLKAGLLNRGRRTVGSGLTS